MPKRKVGESQPKLKLYYFDMAGKGEPIRLLCAYAGLELEDFRFESFAAFNEMKDSGKLPFGQVPFLEVDERGDGQKIHQLVQSSAILRYLGQLSGLYPSEDLILAAKVDAALAQETDAFIGPTVATYSERFGIVLDDEAMKKSEEMITKEIAPRHLASLEKLFKASKTGWIADTKEPSPADFAWFVRLAFWMPEKPNFFPESVCEFDEYPKIKEFVGKFKELESIKRYYASKK